MMKRVMWRVSILLVSIAIAASICVFFSKGEQFKFEADVGGGMVLYGNEHKYVFAPGWSFYSLGKRLGSTSADEKGFSGKAVHRIEGNDDKTVLYVKHAPFCLPFNLLMREDVYREYEIEQRPPDDIVDASGQIIDIELLKSVAAGLDNREVKFLSRSRDSFQLECRYNDLPGVYRKIAVEAQTEANDDRENGFYVLTTTRVDAMNILLVLKQDT